MGGIETVAAAVEADLAARLARQNKKQRAALERVAALLPAGVRPTLTARTSPAA